MIQVFNSYEDFLERPDKTINGVSTGLSHLPKGANNTGCWNCIQCHNCHDGYYLTCETNSTLKSRLAPLTKPEFWAEQPFGAGICHWAKSAIPLTPIIKTWPKYSGDPNYPIPHPSSSPKEGFELFADNDAALYRHPTKYQYMRDRMELAQHILDGLTLRLREDYMRMGN